jgi:hypothetical protein
MKRHSLFIFYGGKRMLKTLFVLGDADDKCLVGPLTLHPELRIETVRPDCKNPHTITELETNLDEILSRRKESHRVAVFHKSVGGNRKDYTPTQLVGLDAMDDKICGTFRTRGFEVTIIDSDEESCSLKFNEIICQHK